MLSPPSAKKLSSMPTRETPENLGKQRAQHLLLRRARTTQRRSRHRLRRRQRTPVELAVGRQRQPLQHHQRSRHHVVGKPLGQRRPQRSRIDRTTRRRHHIAHQPPLPGHILARDHRRLRNPRTAHQRSLDLARLDAEPAQLQLRIRAPQELQHPVRTPARQIPGPVHPPAAAPMPVGNKPLRRQSRTTQITPRKPRTRNVKLPHNTRRHRLQPAVQHVDPRVPDRPADRDTVVRRTSRCPHRQRCAVDSRLGRAIDIVQARTSWRIVRPACGRRPARAVSPPRQAALQCPRGMAPAQTAVRTSSGTA